MEIKEICEKYKSSTLRLILDYPEKEYAFTSTIENAKKMEKDFVFIVLMPFVNLYSNYEEVIKNPHCKGFIINRGIFGEQNNKVRFHNFMKEIDFTPEVLIVAQNSYDIAYFIANENSKKENLETITIIGTDGVNTIKNILVHNLSKQFNITYANNDLLVWQKMFEPLLIADDETKYAIVEAYIDSEKTVLYSGYSYNNNVIFAKPTLHNINKTKDLEDFADLYLRAIERMERLKSIYTLSDDNIITDRISYKYSNIVHKIPSDKNFEDKNYLIASEFLKSLNIEPDLNFMEENPLYREYSINEHNYFVLNPKRVTYDNVMKTLDIFKSKYKDNSFNIVYEHIKNLGSFKNDLSIKIHKKIAQTNPFSLLLVNTSAHINEIKKINKYIYIKNITADEKNHVSEIVNLKKTIKDMSKNTKSTYVAMQDDFASLFKENN